jgi:TDG/mug DNA glycosylase family protein
LGLTNIADRPSASASELSSSELTQGRARLVQKLELYRPQCLAFLGIGAYRIGFNQPKSQVGEQLRSLGQTRIWLLPNPSGLNAHYSVDDLADLFRDLRQSVME